MKPATREQCPRLSIILGCVLALSGPASAAPRHRKHSEVQVAVWKAKRKTRPRPPAGPALSAERYRRQVRTRVSRLTGKAIEVLKRLIRATPADDPDRPDLLFRLAEHYRELRTQASFRARELDEPIFHAGPGEREQLRGRQQRFEQQEQRWTLRALETYLKIATHRAYASYRRMDEVLFNVADMLNHANRRDRALFFFRRLIRDHPQSRYIPDAYLSFAEHYFNAGQVEQALRLYEQVGRWPDSPLHGYALYKQGWCWLNLKDPRRALEKFVQVINAGAKGTPSRGRIPLVREAKKDAVRAYAHVGTPERAWAFFRRIGGNDAHKMLGQLAALYNDQGKFAEAILVYRKLIALSPDSKELCRWQHSILEATRSTKDKQLQLVEARRLAAVNKALSTDRQPAVLRRRCAQRTSAALRELATTWHRECQVTQNLDTCRRARALYEAYLDRFADEPPAYQMAFYLAELLFKLEQWQPAAAAYTRVVRMRPRGAQLAEAAYAAVLAWQNALDVKEDPEPAARRDIRKPVPIGPGHGRMLEAMRDFARLVPDSPELVRVLYQIGRVYYEHNRYAEAAKAFAALPARYPAHPLAEFAIKLMLDSLNVLGREREIARHVERFLGDERVARGELRKHLEELQLQLKLKRAEALRKAGRHRACGDLYVQLANAHPNHPRWAQMLAGAAGCFETAKLIGQAIRIRDTLIRTKPDDPLAQRAMLQIGRNYHALAWYSRAASYYEQFARRFPGEPDAPDALQNAIVFHMGRGDHAAALEAARLFTKTYGGRRQHAARAAAVHFALGTVHEAANDDEALVQHYRKYLERWGKVGGLDRQVEAHVKLGAALWKQACPVAGVDGICMRMQRARSRRVVARRRRPEQGLRTHCGPETKMKVTLVPRGAARLRAALGHFERALALHARARRQPDLGVDLPDEERKRRTAELRSAVAQAHFHLGEARFEAFLAVQFPEKLDFSTRAPGRAARSRQRFGEYLKVKSQKLEQARAVYRQVIKLKAPHWAIAAAARVGQLFQNSADALYTAPIPKPTIPRSLTTPRARREYLLAFQDAYCTELEEWAIKLEDKAVQGLQACLDKATALSWYNEWSGMCERELEQIRPGDKPASAEIRAEPGYVRLRPARTGLIPALP